MLYYTTFYIIGYCQTTIGQTPRLTRLTFNTAASENVFECGIRDF